MPSNRNEVPQDENAERCVLGSMLQTYNDERLDADLFVHEGRRAIFLAIDAMKADGGLILPEGFSDVYALDAIARENANRVAGFIERAGTWKATGGPESELRECVTAVTQGVLIDHYTGLLIASWKRRRLIDFSGLMLDAAFSSDDPADLIAGIDLSEVTNGAPGLHATPSPVLRRMADIRSEPIRWLWPQRIARGKLTLIAGDPGLGKSFLTLDLAARVSRGTCWPDGSGVDGAGGVVLLSAEDDPADTIRPRLDAAGAEVDRITILEAIEFRDRETGVKRERSLCLQSDLAALEDAIEHTPECRLVVIDPITAYCGGVDSHKNADIRGLLAPLSALAQRQDVAVLAVTHLNKAAGMSALHRAMGSLAFVAAARAVWIVTRDNDDRTGDRRLMLPAKNNIGNDRSGLAFALKSTSSPAGTAVVAWSADPVTVTADEALAPHDGRKDRTSPVLDEACEWLQHQLADGPKPSRELLETAEADGIKESALRRAKSKLNVGAKRDGFGSAGAWAWKLPDSAGDANASAPMAEEHPSPNS